MQYSFVAFMSPQKDTVQTLLILMGFSVAGDSTAGDQVRSAAGNVGGRSPESPPPIQHGRGGYHQTEHCPPQPQNMDG